MQTLTSQRRSRTDERTSVPRRSERPGHKKGRNNLRYWIAKQVTPDPMGFRDECIPLPVRAADQTEEAWEAMISELCREHTARLEGWIDARKTGEPLPVAQLRYDGSVESACNYFQDHELSPYNTTMKFNSQATARSSLKLIKATVGKRVMRNVTVPDCRSWYGKWRAPYFEGDREHIKRAHEAISTFRQVVYFMASLRFADCKPLAAELQLVQFEKAQAREQEMTLAQVCAFIRTGLELGQKQIIPVERGLYMALGVAAQFDLTAVRQRDVIGEWADTTARRKMPVGISKVQGEGEAWIGYFTWESIPGWRWRPKTFKSSFRKSFDFNLQNYGLLYPLLDSVPHEERTGSIVKGEHGLPIRSRSYGNWFRDIATAAGIPEDVWNMDNRAGGASEAFAATGGDIAALQGLFKHSTQAMSWRYVRGSVGSSVTDAFAAARNKKRAADGSGTP